MRTGILFGIIAILYAVVFYLAVVFAPPEPIYTEDWKEAQKLVRECEGTAVVSKTLSGFEVTCYVP